MQQRHKQQQFDIVILLSIKHLCPRRNTHTTRTCTMCAREQYSCYNRIKHKSTPGVRQQYRHYSQHCTRKRVCWRVCGVHTLKIACGSMYTRSLSDPCGIWHLRHVTLSHVTHAYKSCHIHIWQNSIHIWMKSHMNEFTYEWIDVWTNSHMNELKYDWIDIWMNSHMNEFTYEWIHLRHVTHGYKTCHDYKSYSHMNR